jgi:hypothetical protein
VNRLDATHTVRVKRLRKVAADRGGMNFLEIKNLLLKKMKRGNCP